MNTNFSTIYYVSLLIAIVGAAARDDSVTNLKDSLPCGDWIPYKDKKCIKIVDSAGFQNHQDAQVYSCGFYLRSVTRTRSPNCLLAPDSLDGRDLHLRRTLLSGRRRRCCSFW